LVARVAAEAFDLDPARTTDPPQDGMDLPQLRAAMAAVAGRSGCHFARQFKRATGQPPHQYVIARRVERAKQLLQETMAACGLFSTTSGIETLRRNHDFIGKYLNEFRAREGFDTSYTKDFADFREGEAVKPPEGMLYVGWTEPGEWMNYTVDVAEDGDFTVDILYTSNRGGELSLDVNGKPLDKPITIASTNDPKDTTGWRQWHHWNINTDAATVKLSKGRNLLTLHIVKKGNMSLGTLEFKSLRM
jgi:AraC-like DNA-binding protein